ncbi:hypothetical protein VTO73DRAFT_2628 [Trametes versicolor]
MGKSVRRLWSTRSSCDVISWTARRVRICKRIRIESTRCGREQGQAGRQRRSKPGEWTNCARNNWGKQDVREGRHGRDV